MTRGTISAERLINSAHATGQLGDELAEDMLAAVARIEGDGSEQFVYHLYRDGTVAGDRVLIGDPTPENFAYYYDEDYVPLTDPDAASYREVLGGIDHALNRMMDAAGVPEVEPKAKAKR